MMRLEGEARRIMENAEDRRRELSSREDTLADWEAALSRKESQLQALQVA